MILSAQADSGLLVPGLFNVEKWPGDLGESAIENYGNINLGDLNQNPPCPKYLDYLFFSSFFLLFFVCFLVRLINESDNQHCLLMTWLQKTQVNYYIPFTWTITTYSLVVSLLKVFSSFQLLFLCHPCIVLLVNVLL